jgi:hypothetical protein
MKKWIVAGLIILGIFIYSSTFNWATSVFGVEEYTNQAITKHDISVCDKIRVISLGISSDRSQAICYEEYVKRYPYEKVCPTLLKNMSIEEFDLPYTRSTEASQVKSNYEGCVSSAAVSARDVSLCFQNLKANWTCTASVARTKNDIGICKLLSKDEIEKCATSFNNFSQRYIPTTSSQF